MPSRHQHLVAELLGLRAEVADLAGAALLAVEAELVVVGGAAFGVLQAVRQEHQPAVERNRRDLLAPELVREHDHREAEELLAEAERFQNLRRHLARRFLRERLRFVEDLQYCSTAARIESRMARSCGTSLNAALFSFGGLVGATSTVAFRSISTAVVTGQSLGNSGVDARMTLDRILVGQVRNSVPELAADTN